jgi:hypothetical protein
MNKSSLTKLAQVFSRQSEGLLESGRIRETAMQCQLARHLMNSVNSFADFAFLTTETEELLEVEAALRDACYCIFEYKKLAVPFDNGMSLLHVLLHEAEQQQKFAPLCRLGPADGAEEELPSLIRVIQWECQTGELRV